MNNQLRVCIVTLLFSPIVGGAEIRAQKQALQLQKLGHKVVVITLRHHRSWKRREVIDGVSVIRVGGLYTRHGSLRIGRLGHLPIDLLLFITLWRLRSTYDVLHVIQLSPLAGVTTLVSQLTSKPVVISMPSTGSGKRQTALDAHLMADTLAERSHDLSFLKVPYSTLLFGGPNAMQQTALGGESILHYIKRSEAFYHILSHRSREVLISHGFRADKIVCIPNGVDTQKFYPRPEVRPDPAGPERDIVCVARLAFPKGIDILLHAWHRMMSKPDAWRSHLRPRLLLVGSGDLQPQLERITQELGIQESVLFLGLITNVVPYLQAAWGFVLPSRWEGMPNALVEAMACEVPCISSRVSGSEDVIQSGVNGVLVEPEQPAELAQALRRIIEDTNFAQTLAHNGLETVLREYQLKHITEQMLDLYYRALNQ